MFGSRATRRGIDKGHESVPTRGRLAAPSAMSDTKPKPSTQPTPPASGRPAPPPYSPNRELIGYIERGQTGPAQVRKRWRFG